MGDIWQCIHTLISEVESCDKLISRETSSGVLGDDAWSVFVCGSGTVLYDLAHSGLDYIHRHIMNVIIFSQRDNDIVSISSSNLTEPVGLINVGHIM